MIVFGRRRRPIFDRSEELRAPVSPVQTRTAHLDDGPAMPQVSDAELTVLAPSARDLQHVLDTSEAELADLMQQLEASTSRRQGEPIALLPYLMLPAECWDTAHQRVLVETLDLMPTQRWNVLPLAATAEDAEALDVVQHPLVVTPGVIQQSQKLVEGIIETMLDDLERATFGGESVDTDALAEARTAARSEIVSLARSIAAAELGADAVDSARALLVDD